LAFISKKHKIQRAQIKFAFVFNSKFVSNNMIYKLNNELTIEPLGDFGWGWLIGGIAKCGSFLSVFV